MVICPLLTNYREHNVDVLDTILKGTRLSSNASPIGDDAFENVARMFDLGVVISRWSGETTQFFLLQKK